MSIPYYSPSKGGLSLLIPQSWVPDWLPCLRVEPFLDSSNNLFQMLLCSVAYQWLHSKESRRLFFKFICSLLFHKMFRTPWFVYVCVLTVSHVQLFVTPWTSFSLPVSSVHGILQTRILEWVAISFSRGSSRPRNQTWVSLVAGRCFAI